MEILVDNNGPELDSRQTPNDEQYDVDKLKDDLGTLFTFALNRSPNGKSIIYTIGTLLTGISAIGVLYGYKHGYTRSLKLNNLPPTFERLPPIMKLSMALGGIAVWVLLILFLVGIRMIFGTDIYQQHGLLILMSFLITNLVITKIAFGMFNKWRVSIANMMKEKTKYASARYAEISELAEYSWIYKGPYIGGCLTFPKSGHILLVAGTRGGKSENILMANLLGIGGSENSFFVHDPKAELCSVAKDSLAARGYEVIILNPLRLLPGILPDNDCFNPLDIFLDASSSSVVDDVQTLAYMLVEEVPNDPNVFFKQAARSIIAGILLHIVTSENIEKSLATLWRMVRLAGNDWNELLVSMATNNHPEHGEAVRLSANEILKAAGSQETFSSIMTNVLLATDWLKSQAIRNSLKSNLDPYSLNKKKVAVFLCMPVDRLNTYSRYLRIVTTSLMKAIVKQPAKRKVTFLIDECSALGRVEEIETALSSYAAFGVQMFLVFQDIPQMESLYGNKYQSIISNSAVRIFFSCKDMMTANMISDLMGETTRTTYTTNFWGSISDIQSSPRKLATANEVMRMSADEMILFIAEKPVITFPKLPYYKMPELKKDRKNLYNPNPYVDGGGL